MSCECFWGTPVEGKDGSCTCIGSGPNACPPGSELYNKQCVPSSLMPTVRPPKSLGGGLIPPFGPGGAVAASMCAARKAPNGYQYQMDAYGNCNLVVNYAYDPSRPGAVSNAAAGAGAIQDTISNLLTDHKEAIGLVALLAVGYLVMKSGGAKPKTRERDVITKTY